MSELSVGLWTDIGLELDFEAAEPEAAVSQLRRELLELEMDAVERPPAEQPPPGPRAVEAAALGTLLVAAGRGAIGVVVRLRTLQAWVARRSSRTVKLTLDGDSIELMNASSRAQRRLTESVVAHHASGPP
jgi:ferric-dicitrate binding protein FerR (iron transport regulator)